MSYSTLYTIGLCLVILYLLMGIDDLVWDLSSLIHRRLFKEQKMSVEELNSTTPKLLAMMIAAWHEDNVLGSVVENMIESVQYPRSMYHIFLGVYPNDSATIAVAEALSEKYDNVHVIINDLPGPTSKAQNLNHVIREIKKFEKQFGWKFQSITVHDSEDVIHPDELLATNCLLEKYPAVQFPVFPLMEMPTFRNFFKNITVNTYADEFAENHFTTMVNRCSMKAFVPSAGTGFALSRAVIESFGDEDVLPRDSLTEDYRLSLTLHEKGMQLHYVLEKLPRLKNDGKMHWDYIATRSRFPSTYRAAVKQKTRWILGITMQSFRLKDVFKTKDMNAVSKYTLYKDSKAKIGNLLSMVGYPILIYFLCSLFIDLPPIYPKYTLSWWLCCFVTFMMLERQFFRCIALYNVYGLRTVFFSVFFPPLFPLRLIWGNIINLESTVRAYCQFLSGRGKKQEKNIAKKENEKAENKIKTEVKQSTTNSKPLKPIAWAKTDHEFLDKKILLRYRRNLGDILLQRDEINIDDLKYALENKGNELLGSYLVKNGFVTYDQIVIALATSTMIPYTLEKDLSSYPVYTTCNSLNYKWNENNPAIPLFKINNQCIIGCTVDITDEILRNLSQQFKSEIALVYITEEAFLNAKEKINSSSKLDVDLMDSIEGKLLNEQRINYEQYVLVRNVCLSHKCTSSEALLSMGLI